MYNKKYYHKIFTDLVEPLIKYYSSENANLVLGTTAAAYGNDIGKMEGFSRILWGFVPFLYGGGSNDELLSIYQNGLKNGVRQDSKEYWGDISDFDQRMVEMAAISYALLMLPEYFWEGLDQEAKENLSKWLYTINLYDMPKTNWQFFRVLTNLALKSVGENYSKEQISKGVALYESFYLGNGWYSDGDRPQKDYYTSFAIHYYCLLYSKFMQDEEPDRCSLYKERASFFSKTFIYWFDDEGKSIPFGRSLTYRFAEVSFWSACLLAEVPTFSVGVVKGLITRHLEYWLRQPIFDNGKILTVGYTYPNLLMSENYNSTGSPYWAFKAFAFLALDDKHEFWKCAIEALPTGDAAVLIKESNMIITKSPYDVKALTSGQYPSKNFTHCAEKYSKFAYSSAFGFSVPRSYFTLEETAPDSMLAFYVNGMYYVRRKCKSYTLEKDKIVSIWSPCKDIEVETTLIPTKNGHVRKHKVTSNIECVAYDSGYSYPKNRTKIKYMIDDKLSCVYDENGKSQVKSTMGKAMVINPSPNTNLVFPVTSIPSIEIKIGIGVTKFESVVETDFTMKGVYVGGDCYEVRDEQ
ncbi:DUF2264 domain-containing protein [Vallitaleaceae bacterium 9-2]